MKTKIQIMGEENEGREAKKAIYFGELLLNDGDWSRNGNFRRDSSIFVTLICKNYFKEGYHDLFLTHDTENPSDDPENAVLWRGNWNDGILEE